MPSAPLEGITVVAIEQAVAAPFATRQLADLGARVIKIERPGTGDFCRDYDTTVNGLASHFVWLNRTKESVTLDLKREEAKAVLERLLARADGLVSAVTRYECAIRDSSFATSPDLVHSDRMRTRRPTT
jgi:itaconate CoA-transferase